MEISVYTDGGCSGNPGPGGWAVIITADGARVPLSGGQEATTNNRMELMAVIKALDYVRGRHDWKNADVIVHTDSQYVQKGISQWIRTWERNGWKTSDRKPVKNKDLWTALREAERELDVSWRWVRGHSGNPLNEACDSMVREQIERMQ